MKKENIILKGMRENNLKNVSLEIPKRKITVFTGVSGSGKSSIVFDTIAQEAGRQLNENFSKFARTFLPKYKQPEVDEIDNLSMAVIVDQSRLGGNSRSTLGTITDINPLFRLLFSRFGKPYLGPAWNFSFNDPHGMCKECEGIGRIVTLDLEKAIDFNKSLAEGAILLPGYKIDTWMWKFYSKSGFFDETKPIKDYTEEELHKLFYADAEKIESTLIDGMNTTYMGIVKRFESQYIKTDKEVSVATINKIKDFQSEIVCYECHGKRFNNDVLNCKIDGHSISDFFEMELRELVEVLKNLKLDKSANKLTENIIMRLDDLIDVGLDYISLNRETSTLSGGESQRVKMVKQLASGLMDSIYIFDEPSIGLHPRDVHRLNDLLVKIRDRGNTVIVVEHDPDVISVADWIVDVGPKAGVNGGEIVFTGTYDDLLKSDTLTGKNLSLKRPFKEKTISPTEFYRTSKSSLHNLKDISLNIPKGLFTVVTGVAGSGKSTLVNGVFAKEFPDCINIDQSAVGVNIRSNPATYTGIMDEIRKLFAQENKVSAGLFSYNSEGACPSCKGHGIVKTELSFMEAIETVCEDCNGKRYDTDVFKYKVNNKNVAEVLDLTIVQALEFFAEVPNVSKITKKLQSLVDVGIGYMTLGQPLNTLSGGECQRIKLANELTKKGNIYIMDEPTTGLHNSDIGHILDIINKLVKKGNTVIVIEHNLDIMRNADWLIDVGLDGGSRGGEIIFEGKPIDLQKSKKSITSKYLGM